MSVSVLQPSRRSARSFVSALTATVRVEGIRVVVVLRGVADLAARPVLAGALSRVIAYGVNDVVIDLAGVRFIDTAIIHSLAVCRELLGRRHRTLTLRAPSRLATQMLDLAGLSALIETFGTAS